MSPSKYIIDNVNVVDDPDYLMALDVKLRTTRDESYLCGYFIVEVGKRSFIHKSSNARLHSALTLHNSHDGNIVAVMEVFNAATGDVTILPLVIVDAGAKEFILSYRLRKTL